MGQRIGLTCAGCGYTVDVSGGNDVGMRIAMTTIECTDCLQLFDVTVSNEPWALVNSRDGEIPIACPRRKRHSVRRWQYPGPCPKCGAAMEPNGTYILWD